jgi:hypothetical protein
MATPSCALIHEPTFQQSAGAVIVTKARLIKERARGLRPDHAPARRWYNSGRHSRRTQGEIPAFNPHEITMSADKDRGIRREKQKRAKDKKKPAKPQPKPATPAAA